MVNCKLILRVFSQSKRCCFWFVLTFLGVVLILNPIFAIANDTPNSKSSQPIIVGVELDYPPYSFLDSDGKATGFDAELTRAVAEVMGMTIEIQIRPWAQIRSDLEKGKIDAIAGMFYSEVRDKLVDFTPAFFLVQNAIFAHPNSPDISSVKELKNKRIIVVKGDILHDYVVENGLYNELELADTLLDAIALLTLGEHDFALLAQLPGLYLIKELGFSSISTKGPLVSPSKYCFAVRQGNSDLLAKFTEGIKILEQKGLFKEIYEKYLGVLEPPGISLGAIIKYAFIILIPLIVLLLLSFLWSKSLQKKVSQRTKSLENEIIEHKRTEAALLLSQQKLALHLLQTPLAVVELDLDSKIQAWNPSAEKMFGYTGNEILGENVSIIVPEEDWVHIEPVFSDLYQNKGSSQNTNRNINKNGDILYCEWFNTSIVDESGKMIAVVSLGQNITKRWETEKALELNEKRYRELFDHMTSGVAVYSVKNNGDSFIFKDFNQSAEQITGTTREHVYGKEAIQVFPGLDSIGIINNFRQVYHSGNAMYLPARLYKDNKINIWVESYIYKLPSGEIVSVFNDMSDKIQAEMKLQVERDKLQSVINGIGDNLYIVDKNYIIEFQNDLFKERFGDQIGQICYTAFSQFEKPCKFCCMQDCLELKSIKQVETGSINAKSYEMNFSPFHESDKEGKTVVLLRDITEKKSLQAEAMRAGHLASLGELAAGVAHEINNPVTGIISIAELMSDKFEQLGGDKKIPERIINEGERISKIVKNLLSFARVNHDEYSPSRIGDVLKSTIELVEKQILKDGIYLTVNILPDIPEIRANDQEIQQVFLNLISNARYSLNEKFPDPTRNKKLKISTEIISLERENFIRIIFIDSGVGIQKSLLGVIADPFYSTKPQGEGTGLGLSISHGIINNHRGHLVFDSQAGEYTKVYVELPIDVNENSKKEKNEIKNPNS